MALSKVDIASLADCVSCGLYKKCSSPMMRGRGGASARLVVVGEAPGRMEDAKGRPFVGLSGQFLRGCLEDAGVRPGDLFLTNVNRCWPGLDDMGSDGKALDRQVRACAPAVLAEIADVSPEVVLLLGNKALKGVLGLDKISEHRGRVIEREGRLYIPAYHPAFVLRETRNLRPGEVSRAVDAWQHDITLVASALAGQDVRPVPPTPLVPIKVAEVKALLASARASRVVSFDYEATGLNPYRREAQLLTVGLAWRDSQGDLLSMFIPLDHPGASWEHLERLEVKDALKGLLADRRVHLIGSNLKFEYLWSALHLGVELAGFLWSTDLMHALIDEKREPGHGLKTLASLVGYGGYDQPLDRWLAQHTLEVPDEEGVRPVVREIRPGERVKSLTMADLEQVPLSEICSYNAADAYVTYLLFEHLAPILEANDHAWHYKHVTSKQIKLLARMELQGLSVDIKEQRRQQLAAVRRMEELTQSMTRLPKVQRYIASRAAAERQAWERETGGFIEASAIWNNPATGKPTRVWPFRWTERVTGEPVPLLFSSDPQLKDYFYSFLSYTPRAHTKTGPALGKEDLAALSSKRDGLAVLLVEYRRVKKLKEAFLDPVSSWIQPDGKVRTSFRIAGAETGRTSSGAIGPKDPAPNLQQVPREGQGCEIKKIYVSSFYGGYLVEADQGQIEPRLIADLSQDPRMLEIVRDPQTDIHTGFTAMAWTIFTGKRVRVSEVSKEMRQRGKSLLSLGVLYGQEARGLARKMGWPLAKAIQFLNELWESIPGVVAWQDRVKAECFKYGYAKTKTGRRRHLPDIRSDEEHVAAEAGRQAVNLGPQGLASDIVQVQGFLVDRELARRGFRSRLVGTTHDSLLVDTPLEETAEVAVILRRIMEGGELLPERFSLDVPLQADVKLGRTWAAEAGECKSRDYPGDDALRTAIEVAIGRLPARSEYKEQEIAIETSCG